MENLALLDADPEDLPEYATTDAGNAERLIAAYGDRARYCAAFNTWYLWSGKVWVRDDAGKMLLIATDVARSIHREAAVASTADRSRALSRWAIISESLHARKAMIDSAAPHCPVLPGEFDARPELFNCRNGTLELATMTFREHRKEEMLTKKAAVDYDEKAQCPQWLAHLNLIFGSDTDYLSGFQSMCGYTLLGTNPQQIMFILYGRGRNGKSKTIEVLARIFADNAVNIAADSLMAKCFENARSDLARLSGARLATAAEGAEGARMDEAIIKQITGEYVITVRKLYENEFEFTPVAKIWMTTNHEPVIPGTDDGIWRRIWMVPFPVQIPEEKCDPDIAAKLLAESSGILNWCLSGLSRYYANGNRLVQPRKVSQATANLRTVSDTVGLFLATECSLEVGAKIPRTTFREILDKWFDEEGIKYPPHSRKVANILKEHGVMDGGRSNGERYWAGIRWKNANEREVLEQAGSFQDVLSGV
jgi:putative DNA primase/helicase